MTSIDPAVVLTAILVGGSVLSLVVALVIADLEYQRGGRLDRKGRR